MLQSSLFVSSGDPLISQESCHMFVRNSFRVGFSLKPYTLFQGRSQTKREEVRETMKRTHRVLVLLVVHLVRRRRLARLRRRLGSRVELYKWSGKNQARQVDRDKDVLCVSRDSFLLPGPLVCFLRFYL